MAKTALIQTRIEPEIKAKAKKILDTLQISMSEAISLYLTQVTLHNGIPFKVEIPNKKTLQSINKSENSKKINEVENIDKLFEELDN